MAPFKFYKMEPDKAYISNNLILPKSLIAETPVKRALELVHGEIELIDEMGNHMGTKPNILRLWDENEHHIIAPREFIPRRDHSRFDFEFVDHSPKKFPKVDFLDLIQLRDREQEAALQAMLDNHSGTLNLSCVSGGTILNLNRGGKGFRMTIREAHKRFSHEGRYEWDPTITTYVRSKVGEEIRLTRVLDVLYKGRKRTLQISLKNGRLLRLTEDHEVLTSGGYVPAAQLCIGDQVFTDGRRRHGRKEKRAYRRIGGFWYHPYSSSHRPGYQAFGNYPTLVPVTGVSAGLVEDVYDLACDEPHNFVANGIVVHNCGLGKTVIALKLAARLRVPTIVVVNTTALLEQWKDEAQKHLGLTAVGVVQGSTAQWENHPLVLAMVHTLSGRRNDWSSKFRRRFGLIIYDEGHHMSAPVFVKSADLFYGRRYSLTATAERLDGTERVYQFHLGSVIHTNLTQQLIPKTVFHRLKWQMPIGDKKFVTDVSGETNLSKVRGYLGTLKWRNNIIYRDLQQDLAVGRTILVLTHSVKHANALNEYLSARGSGLVTGATQQGDRLVVLRGCNPVFGTFQLAREGLNKPELDTLYVLTPFASRNDRQQAWGRIQRQCEGKKPPLVRVYEDTAFQGSVKSCQVLRRDLRYHGYPLEMKNINVGATE